MKIPLLDLSGKQKSELELPKQFKEPVRTDLIQRAVLALRSAMRQVQGLMEGAGERHAAKLSRRRKNYKGAYGKGIGRCSRKTMSHRGGQFNWVGAMTPNTRGGRRAHGPITEKIYAESINKKEKRKALRSAMSASMDVQIVAGRGHKTPAHYPFAIEQKFEGLQTTSDVRKTFDALNLTEEIARCSVTSMRAGRAKMRNRARKVKKGPLIITSGPCAAEKACRNIPGVDVQHVDSINTQYFAPGGDAGRLTIWTEAALAKLQKDNMYI